jgi:hypothetical protein
MRKRMIALVVFVAATLSAQPQGACDRACLEGFANRYLDALAAHNPSALPLAPKFMFTENDATTEIGGGAWETVTGVGKYKLYAADPQAGQVAFLGILKENNASAAFALRLKIVNQRIEEIETLVVREGGAGNSVEEMGTPDPSFLEVAPAAGRLSRQGLVAAADAYWNAVVQSDGAKASFDRSCNRIQNGVQTTNNPELSITPGWSWNPLALGCEEQLNTRFFSFIRGAARRWLLVDEDRQVVFGFIMVQAPGTVTSIDSPGHGKNDLPASVTGRYNIDVAELYKFRNGKIRQVEAIQTRLPYGTMSPFSGQK